MRSDCLLRRRKQIEPCGAPKDHEQASVKTGFLTASSALS
jgi:hypothetical protein